MLVAHLCIWWREVQLKLMVAAACKEQQINIDSVEAIHRYAIPYLNTGMVHCARGAPQQHAWIRLLTSCFNDCHGLLLNTCQVQKVCLLPASIRNEVQRLAPCQAWCCRSPPSGGSSPVRVWDDTCDVCHTGCWYDSYAAWGHQAGKIAPPGLKLLGVYSRC